MKQAASLFVFAGLTVGLTVGVSSCNGGGGGGGGGGAGGLFVQSCTLGCSNGVGGTQVSCGLINTFQNQDVSLVFNDTVNVGTVNNNTFQVIDTGTGAVPPGSYVIDGNKVAFRPRLTFDATGTPVFGFVDGGTYQIKLPGTSQGDVAPYVMSTSGKANESRVLCTITTDQGLIDAVPGDPTVTIWVNAIDPVTLVETRKKVDSANPNDPLLLLPTDRVTTDSDIEFVFNDLMNLGTVVVPSLGTATFITVKVDTDGDTNTLSDQVDLAGTYTFCVGQTSFVNQTNLTTCVRFRATNGMPSSGANLSAPRQVVITVPSTVVDLKGNGVANAGKRAFVPEQINFTPVVLPTGGEQFTSTSNMDTRRSGAYWGEAPGGTFGRLTPGQGGGSGRLGDLTVTGATPITFYTSSIAAQGRITMTANPKPADNGYLQINGGPQFLFKKNPASPLNYMEIKVGDFIADTLREAAVFLNANVIGDPEVAKCRYWVENNNQLVCEYKTLGSVGNGFMLTIFPAAAPGSTQPIGYVEGGSVPAGAAYSTGPLTPGIDWVEFGDNEPTEGLLTNLFNASEGDPVDHYFSTDGVFEFASIELQAGALLRFIGRNPPRLYARGRFVMADTATIDVAGLDLGAHMSADPVGQSGGAVVDAGAPLGFRLVGGLAGPGGGHGGQGADRANYPTFLVDGVTPHPLTVIANGPPVTAPIVNHALTEFYAPPAPGTVPVLVDGRSGDGVGGPLGFGLGATTGLAQGIGGARGPTNFPTNLSAFADLATSGTCVSQQVSAPGSGGAFATDGTSGAPMAAVANATYPVSMPANAPAPTAAGDSTQLNLEPASAPGPKRSLSPENGYLRGGAGGGGGGVHLSDTTTAGGVPDCLSGPAAINRFRDHSGAGGGGGGGAVQVVAGRRAQIDGLVDAAGGNGGDVNSSSVFDYGRLAVPGGGGAGGGVLLQAREILFGGLPNRIDVAGGGGGAGPNAAFGGTGGNGLVRVEDRLGLTATAIANSINPQDPLFPSTSPDHRWLSVGQWQDQVVRPDSYSGAQSCWMRVTGNFFSLSFDGDVGGTYGWDMELFVDIPGVGLRRVNYRNPAPASASSGSGVPAHTTSAWLGGNTSEAFWGTCIDGGTLPPQCGGGAPIIVRFQGARAGPSIVDLCTVNVSSTTEVQFGSLTPWVMHPTELNNFQPPPDMVRFQIVFDRSHPDFPMIEGITNVQVHATPD